MKRIKNYASFLLALIVLLSVSSMAFAAGDGTITINNATVGQTYNVHKVFDLTYAGDPADAVAYTFTQNDQNNALYAALSGETSPFTLTLSSTANVYNVALKDGKTADDISSFLKQKVDLLPASSGTTTATTTTVGFTGLEYGYYYITSTLGGTVTIDSTTPNVTVIDKNQTPGWDKEGTGPDTGKVVSASENGTYGKSSTAEIKDTVYFKVNTYAPKYAGDKLISTYTYTDTLAKGFTLNSDTLKVQLKNGAVLTKGVDYAVSIAEKAVDGSQTFTIVIDPNTVATYPTDANLVISYNATMDEDAVYDNTNTVSMKWEVFPNDANDKPIIGDPLNPAYDPNTTENAGKKEDSDPANPGNSETHTFVFAFNLQKYKEQVAEGNKLTGAKFELYDADTEGNKIPLVKIADGKYRVASATEAAAADFVSAEIEAGAANIFGLDVGSYFLQETLAPSGYNLLEARVEIEISADSANQTDGVMNNTTDIINNAGTVLPSTGGAGTTLFYILGGLLVAGAVILLVTKKRMSDAER